MNVFENYYSSYQNSFQGFTVFHNEVINMPRDQFSDAGLTKVRVLAGYLLLTEGKISHEGESYKMIMDFIHNEYSCAVTPQIRQTGNRLSGNAGTAYASLLA